MPSFSLYDTAGSMAGVFIGGIIVYKAMVWKLKDIVKAHDELRVDVKEDIKDLKNTKLDKNKCAINELKTEVRNEVKQLKDTKLDSERFNEIRSHIDTKFKYHGDQLNIQNRTIMSINEKLDKLLSRRRSDREYNKEG